MTGFNIEGMGSEIPIKICQVRKTPKWSYCVTLANLALEKKIPLIYPYREKHKNKSSEKYDMTA